MRGRLGATNAGENRPAFRLAEALGGWLFDKPERPPASGGADWPEEARTLRLLEGIAVALKAPLATINGFAEVLSAVGGLPSRDEQEIRRCCRFILENSQNLSAFAAQLHDFVRYEQGQLRLMEQQVDAAELIEAALGLCSETADRADVVIFGTLLDGVELRCDASRVRQSIATLVLRAATAAPAGTTVRVRLGRLPGGGAVIAIGSPVRTEQPRDTAALFDPQLALEGLNGLALPIARRVALLHSGELTIESEPDGPTTTARFILPPHRVL